MTRESKRQKEHGLNSKALVGIILVLSLVFAAVQPARAAEPGNAGTPAGKSGAAPAGVRLPVAYSAPAKGLVSLALFNQEGVLVRSLLYAQPVEAGTHTVMWDGTTDLGKPAPAGTYTAKGIYFANPPTVKLNMFVGKSGNPPWRTADGKGDWGANQGPGTSIVSDGKTVIAAFSQVEDNQITGVQQMDGDGNISLRYFTFFTYDQRCAAAMDGAGYYLGLWCGGYYGQRKGLLPYLYGDYYPLTPGGPSEADWIAWQFHRPDLGEGMVQVFRRKDSPFETARFRLRGLEPEADYEVTDLDRPDEHTTMTGRELMETGAAITMREQPQAVIMTYNTRSMHEQPILFAGRPARLERGVDLARCNGGVGGGGADAGAGGRSGRRGLRAVGGRARDVVHL
jgi:hypothetical protein